MSHKTTLTFAAAVLLAGAGAVLFVNRDRSSSGTGSDPASTAGSHAGRFNPSSSPSAGESGAEASARSHARNSASSSNPELVASFGDARVNLSKRVAGDMIGMLDDAAKMGELVASGQLAGAFGGPEARVKKAIGPMGEQLHLSAEQLDKASKALAEYQRQSVERTRDSVSRLRKDSSSLMEMILASDAYLRGEMQEDRYQQIRATALGQLGDLMNPLDRENFHGGRPLQDEGFVKSFGEILDPAQREVLDAALAGMEKPANRGHLSELPAMPLEKLSDVISTSRKLTEGHRQMLEGMGTLEAMQAEGGK